jgi:hypothetical protein
MTIRPRLSEEHGQALAIAAGLSNMTTNKYLEVVIRPLVEADAAERLSRSKYAASEDGSSEDK